MHEIWISEVMEMSYTSDIKAWYDCAIDPLDMSFGSEILPNTDGQ